MPFPLAIPAGVAAWSAAHPILAGGAGSLAALLGFEGVLAGIDAMGGDLEEEIHKRLMAETAAERGADIREADVMEARLKAAELGRKVTQGMGLSDREFMVNMMLNPLVSGGFGAPSRDQAVAVMDDIKPGLAARVEDASTLPISPLAMAMGYDPTEV